MNDRADLSGFAPSPTTAQPPRDAGIARDVFVARQPIFDRRTRVHAYELLFRGGLDNICAANEPDRAAGHVLQAAWLTFGLPTLIGTHKAFVNFTRELLVAGYGETLPVDSTVIELLEHVEGDPDVLAACRKLKRAGYLLALDDFVYRPGLEPLVALADVIKIDFRQGDPEREATQVRGLSSPAKLLAEAVETRSEVEQARAMGFDYFQGYFFCKPEILKARAIGGNRLTYLRLLQAVIRPELSIDELDRVIRTDVSMTHRFMKYLGSAAFGFRGSVTSIRQGLVLLGKEHTRRWASLVALGEMGPDKPQEVLVNAALRAAFCERLGTDIGMAARGPDLFLLGALSMVDAMLDRPMAEVVDELPLAPDLRTALMGGAGVLRPVLDFVERYERGDWAGCAELGRRLEIVDTQVLTRYREAVAWASQALSV